MSILRPTLLLLPLLGLLLAACDFKVDRQTTTEPAPGGSTTLEQFSDSFTLGNITVYNSFREQMLVNRAMPFDTQRIVDNVYRRHQSLWEECYAMAFGPGNAYMFTTDTGMVNWNEGLYRDQRSILDSITTLILSQQVDTMFDYHVTRFKTLDYVIPAARISLAFTPLTRIGFGGCSNDQFVYELNNPSYDVAYTLKAGIPHELFHIINAGAIGEAKQFQAIDLAINEGLACYFVWDYFQGSMPKHEAVEEMSAADWAYYLDHEEEIYQRMKPYFDDSTGDNPLLNNERYRTFPDAPRSLYYWLGFRIVESYLTTNPGTTIKDLSAVPYAQLLTGSNYEGRILR
ncbi:DUF2268 domain-containing putative Zn-dependent protease [Neolewinella sp.]|uniref:DUF2268 domain-containing putative Zn-dependent protease n=1 Tax=Neolewinella sp. TaxID=2993543 RepID=UPI003B521DFA